MQKLIPILAALVLAGCGDVRWTKPGGDSSNVAQDESSCAAAARDQVQRQYGPPVPSSSRYGDPKDGADTGIPSSADRMVLESQSVDRCMRAKGYALVPVGK
jgi:hypothetical protein